MSGSYEDNTESKLSVRLESFTLDNLSQVKVRLVRLKNTNVSDGSSSPSILTLICDSINSLVADIVASILIAHARNEQKKL